MKRSQKLLTLYRIRHRDVKFALVATWSEKSNVAKKKLVYFKSS